MVTGVVGTILALALDSAELAEVITWGIGVTGWIPYIRYVWGSILAQDSLYSHLEARLTDRQPFAIVVDEDGEATDNLWSDQRVTGRFDDVQVHIRMCTYGAEAWIDCAALPHEGEVLVGESGDVHTGALGFDAEVGLRGDGRYWRSLLTASNRAALSAFVGEDGCSIQCESARLHIRVNDDELWKFEARVEGAVRLAKGLETAHQESLAVRLWRAFDEAEGPGQRAIIVRDLAGLPSEREAALERAQGDQAMAVRLVAAELATPPDLSTLQGAALDSKLPAALRLAAVDALTALVAKDTGDIREALMCLLDTDDAVLRAEAQRRLSGMEGAAVGGLAVIDSADELTGGLSVKARKKRRAEGYNRPMQAAETDS